MFIVTEGINLFYILDDLDLIGNSLSIDSNPRTSPPGQLSHRSLRLF